MDDETLGRRIEAHRHEIRVHCYRMLGSAPDAEDATQEAMLKAWQGRESLQDQGALRAWLYRIATHVCLDLAAKRGPRVLPHLAFPPADSGTPPRPFLEDAIWVGPFPDAAPAPDAIHAARETVALAFIAALQHLPAKQRAALLLRDVVDLSAREAADALDTTPAAIEAALARARSTIASRADARRATDVGEASRDLLERYVAAWHARDASAFVALLAEDASFVMPPTPVWFHGKESVGRFVAARLAEHAFLLVPTRANGLPAFALYRAHPEGGHVAHGVQLIDARGDEIVTIHTFLAVKDDRGFRAFGLPARLPEKKSTEGPDTV